MAGRVGDNGAIDVNDDDDALFNDDSFLAAIANVEAQHLGRMTNVLSCNGPKISGEDMYGNGGLDNSVAGKRSAYWEGQHNGHGSSGQMSRAENNSFGSYSEDENRKRIRTENGPFGQEHEERSVSVRDGQKPEGEYMAALRGSNSELWQSSGVGRGIASTAAGLQNRAGTSGGNFKAGSSGNCFKCGMEGHWSKDCTAGGKAVTSPTKRASREGQAVPNVPEKLCPCGTGACSVFTANTEKNMGRSFYRCPLRKDEGQCNFFEWCDAGGQSMPTERANSFQQDFSQQQPQLQCKCGGGVCAVLTAKTDKNMGRQFYKCPLPQSCSYFQWCDEVGRNVGGNSSTTPTRPANFPGNAASPSPGSGATGCYKCGQGGHWSKDCPTQQQQQQYSGSFGGQSQSYNNARGGPTEGSNTGNCYKCGCQGHWSTSCPNSGPPGGQNFARQVGGGTPSSGSCYKCGDPGHWANRCPVAQGGQRS